jgi:hypothetical protein
MTILEMLGIQAVNQPALRPRRVLTQPIGVEPMTRRAMDFGAAAGLDHIDVELRRRLVARDNPRLWG